MKKKGFTLVELLAGIAVSFFLVLVAGVMILTAFNGWDRNADILTRQREATLAIKYFANAVRAAQYDDISVPSTKGSYSDQLTVDDKTFYMIDDTIYYDSGQGQDDLAIINANVQSFSVQKADNGVVVFVTLINDDQTQDFEWVFSCRN